MKCQYSAAICRPGMSAARAWRSFFLRKAESASRPLRRRKCGMVNGCPENAILPEAASFHRSACVKLAATMDMPHTAPILLTADLRRVEKAVLTGRNPVPLMERAGLAAAELARTLAGDSGKPV